MSRPRSAKEHASKTHLGYTEPELTSDYEHAFQGNIDMAIITKKSTKPGKVPTQKWCQLDGGHTGRKGSPPFITKASHQYLSAVHQTSGLTSQLWLVPPLLGAKSGKKMHSASAERLGKALRRSPSLTLYIYVYIYIHIYIYTYMSLPSHRVRHIVYFSVLCLLFPHHSLSLYIYKYIYIYVFLHLLLNLRVSLTKTVQFKRRTTKDDRTAA